MNFEILKNINQIIERDSKDSTYKFALLRATIEIIQEQTPYKKDLKDEISLPLGLLVFKWLVYYYPIIEADLPQKNGDKIQSNSLAFRSIFKEVTDFYQNKGGMSVFYNEFTKGQIDENIEQTVWKLCLNLKQTIKQMPMKYIAYSIYKEHYQVFQPLPTTSRLSKPSKIDLQFLIENFGYFTIPKEYYNVFEYVGSFITGTHSILLNWAEFTVQKSNQNFNINQVLNEMLKSPIQERNTHITNKFFNNLLKDKGSLECVWSGKKIITDLNIEHLLPFAIWKNNDLWNLLPAKASVNAQKSDKIPNLDLLEKRKDCIIDYWRLIQESENEVFNQEISLSLINKVILKTTNWENLAFESFKEKCSYLINVRGFEVWNYQ